jgi:hypothetical protein
MTATAHALEHLQNLDVSVRPEQILRAHYPDLGPVAAEVRVTAAAMAAHALEVASPVAWLREVAVLEIDGARVALEGGATLTSSALAAVLRGSSSVQLFLVTLGPRLDERVTQLFDAMDGLEGLFLDTAGWVVVQSALSTVRRRLGARARAEGYRVTRRVGPGYVDWALEQAPVVVETLAAGNTLLGIEVLESGAILPEKTLTGLYGLIPLAASK